ncbi:MAG: glycosyltransferase family 4 protein [Verrucomicrobiota bacterium]
MKIIQILPELNSGGVERGTLEVGRFLTELGHQSIVISNGGRLVQQLESEGSRHFSLPVHRKHLNSLKQIKVLRKLFEREKPDILHLRSRLPAWLAYLAWRKMDPYTRPKLITTVHGFYSVNAYSAIMTKGANVICVSNGVKDYVLKHYPKVAEDKLTVIHRGVNPVEYPDGYQATEKWLLAWKQIYPQLADKYVVTLPGRITRWKGQLDFIEVIAGLKRKGLPVHGLIVGEPHSKKLEFHKEVKTAIASAGLEKELTLVGHRSDLREVMSISDAVVSCSAEPEAFGRVTLEALTMGKPVAGYAHGGVKEQLDELLPDGLIEIGNITQMTDCLARWHTKPPKPAYNKEFTLANMLAKIKAVYNELLSH